MFEHLIYFVEYKPSDSDQRGDQLEIDCLLQTCIIGFPRWLLYPAKICAEKENINQGRIS